MGDDIDSLPAAQGTGMEFYLDGQSVDSIREQPSE